MIEIKVKPDNEKYDLKELYQIIEMLRSPEGCPWDREQTRKTLIKPMIEEAYEAVDAVEKESIPKLIEELGDVLLQVIFHCIIGQEEQTFGFDDVTDTCARKMIFRHSHVFGDVAAENSGQALANWEEMKKVEKNFGSLGAELADVPDVFPALLRASKVAKKIRKAGLGEVQCPELGDRISDPEKVGELLYRICGAAEKNGVDAESALRDYVRGIVKENENR